MNNLRKILFWMTVFVFIGSIAWASGNIFGAGIIIGEPTGLCAKLFIAEILAIDLAVSWSFLDAAFHIHSDFLFHLIDPFDLAVGDIDFYIGGGGLVKFGRAFKIGIRVPFGVAYVFESIPLDIFLEIAPILELIPATAPSIGGGIGIRYYFIHEKK